MGGFGSICVFVIIFMLFRFSSFGGGEGLLYLFLGEVRFRGGKGFVYGYIILWVWVGSGGNLSSGEFMREKDKFKIVFVLFVY